MQKQCLLFIVLLCSSLEMMPAKHRRRCPQRYPRGSQWRTLLIKAIKKNKSKEAKALLQHGEDPNECTLDLTPLYVALHKTIVPSLTEQLLAYGADPNGHHPRKGWNNLGHAVVYGSPEQVTCLLQAGANPFDMRGEFLPNGDTQKNIALVRKEIKNRIKTFYLCINRIAWKGLPELPNEMRELIKNEIQSIWKNKIGLRMAIKRRKRDAIV